MTKPIVRALLWFRALFNPPAPAAPAPCAAHPFALTFGAHGFNLVPRDTGPSAGSYVVDTERDLIGQVMGVNGARLRLRPPAGGRTWEAEAQNVRPATGAEELSAKVRAVNGWRRWGR
ncbi:hypothetical protein GCM10010218_30840 [Streptomyces mashuensis]|uniref:Secreted protein n=1 Tax=Streptomyces mashuensis TaxID=33904 RepID=A0A919B3J3_9ACTN|nr:hypothetical protein [Streptomyces mashuensis]GHF47327.1 hypothetical protein GCM10010218_30840 [Streptomyces mashuensis]